jgi:hypothetical protein
MIKPVSAHSPVIAAIKRAADKTNNSFDSMLATARAESSLNPAAKAKTSSATGLFQFTKATWLAVAKRHGREAGINPDMPESKLLALRKDPSVAAVMAGFLSNDNRQHLEQRLLLAPAAVRALPPHCHAGWGLFLCPARWLVVAAGWLVGLKRIAQKDTQWK